MVQNDPVVFSQALSGSGGLRVQVQRTSEYGAWGPVQIDWAQTGNGRIDAYSFRTMTGTGKDKEPGAA